QLNASFPQSIDLATTGPSSHGPVFCAVNDLRRCRIGYWLAKGASRVLSRSSIVHFDAPQSVAAAFRIDEMRAICHQSKLENATIRKCWPCRMLLQWHRGC